MTGATADDSDGHRGAASGAERVRGLIWRDGAKVDGFTLAGISDHLHAADTLLWADLECPTHDTLTALAAELDLNAFAIEDTIAAAERVKTVTYRNFTFMTVYAVAPRDTSDPTSTDSPSTPGPSDIRRPRLAQQASSFTQQRISIFLVANALITVRLSPGFDIGAVEQRWDEVGGQQYGIGALLHGLLDVVVDGHFDVVQQLDADIEDLETVLFDDSVPSSTLQRQTYDLRKDLVLLRRVVLPMREVIAATQRRRFENHAPPELDPNFSDLYDHALRAAEWTESLRDMVSTIFETNLSLADARLNTVMKKLTGWAAIVAVPTAITGFYGQNVTFPLDGTVAGFIVSSVLIVVVVGLLYISFRRRDWL